MMLRLIDDVNKALDAECYFSALALMLTFPDICGKAEYPQENSSAKRYKDWYDEYIGKYEQSPSEQCSDKPVPYLSGEVVYSLRCLLLHQGTPNIDVKKIKNNNNKIDNFELVLESKKPFDSCCDAASIYNDRVKSYRVNVRRLCLILCLSVKGYYENNRDNGTWYLPQLLQSAEICRFETWGLCFQGGFERPYRSHWVICRGRLYGRGGRRRLRRTVIPA